MDTEKYKKELETAIYEGVDKKLYIGGKVVEKVLKEAVNEALRIHAVSGSLPTQDEISKAFEHKIILGNNVSKWTGLPEDTPAEYALKMLWFMDGAQFIYDKIKGNDR
jgi:hypothetical protein